MRVLIYGAGVIGSLYAALLSEAGEDVTVYARGKRLQDHPVSVFEHADSRDLYAVPIIRRKN